jgi:hypothetical protein
LFVPGLLAVVILYRASFLAADVLVIRFKEYSHGLYRKDVGGNARSIWV